MCSQKNLKSVPLNALHQQEKRKKFAALKAYGFLSVKIRSSRYCELNKETMDLTILLTVPSGQTRLIDSIEFLLR